MELEAFFPPVGENFFFNEGPILHRYTIWQYPPIHCKARRNSVIF